MTIIKGNRTVMEVLEHHIRVLNACQVDEVVYDYAPDAMIITQDGVVKGLEAIKAFFVNSTQNVLPLGSVSKMMVKICEGDVAYIVWTAESPYFSFLLGTDTFVIRKGEIVEQTFAGLIKQKGSPQ